MPIQSSDVTVNGGTITPVTQGPNLGLILGITIPLGVLLIIIVAYCIFTKTRSAPPNSEIYVNEQTGRGIK